MRTLKVGLIGGGNMGEALIKGLIAKKLALSRDVLVCEADVKRRLYLREKYRITPNDLNTLVRESSVVILAVKPQDMEGVLRQVSQTDRTDKLFISIAAGLSTKYFERHLGKARCVRAMPNMPALIGEGITAICRGRWATPSDLKNAKRLLEAVGAVLQLQEKYMDAVTAVSGSGPAYVFLFVEQWMASARSLGLRAKDAEKLVYETLAGSAHLLKKTALSAGQLRDKVTSKKGTTEAAMKVLLKRNRWGKLMEEALASAKKRAGELVLR